ncbi:hypothetical protein ACWC10_35225 [Streptomyces sp. NPDC001595]|uniref:hypothetical protein n=1 Tax=Streptomyces sp. NPDC001532 TaxID=3154520 RepID=UPI00332AA7FF
MPTFETLPRFTTDPQHLTPAQRRCFRRVVLDAFVPDLRTGHHFRPASREEMERGPCRTQPAPTRAAAA